MFFNKDLLKQIKTPRSAKFTVYFTNKYIYSIGRTQKKRVLWVRNRSNFTLPGIGAVMRVGLNWPSHLKHAKNGNTAPTVSYGHQCTAELVS